MAVYAINESKGLEETLTKEQIKEEIPDIVVSETQPEAVNGRIWIKISS